MTSIEDRDMETVGDKMGNSLALPTRSSTSFSQRLKANVMNNLLLYLTLAGAAIGIMIGFIVRVTLITPSIDVILWLGLPGDLFLRMLKMMIVPLIMTTMICGTGALDAKASGKLGSVAVAYFVLSNLIGSILGIILTVLVKPGKGGSTINNGPVKLSKITTQDIFVDLLRNMIPDNIVRATTSQEVTSYISNEVIKTINSSEGLVNITELVQSRTTEYSHSPNIVGVVVCSVLLGMATSKMKEKASAFLQCTEALSEVLLVVINWFLWITPIGVASMIASSMAAVENLEERFVQMSYFVLIIVVGVTVQIFIINSLIYFVVTRRNPFKVHIAQAKSWLIGFSTTSATAALPDILKGLQVMHVDRRVSLLLAPLGVPMNVNGSNLYISSAAIFLAQVAGMDLNTGQIVTLGILTTMTTLALPPVPSASIVVLLITINTLGIPAHAMGILFTVEWLVDRVRTSSNTIGIGFGVAVAEHICRKDFFKEVTDVSEVDDGITTDEKHFKHKVTEEEHL